MKVPEVDEITIPENFDMRRYIEDLETSLIIVALTQANDSRTMAAKILGIDRSTLHYKMNKYSK